MICSLYSPGQGPYLLLMAWNPCSLLLPCCSCISHASLCHCLSPASPAQPLANEKTRPPSLFSLWFPPPRPPCPACAQSNPSTVFPTQAKRPNLHKIQRTRIQGICPDDESSVTVTHGKVLLPVLEYVLALTLYLYRNPDLLSAHSHHSTDISHHLKLQKPDGRV